MAIRLILAFLLLASAWRQPEAAGQKASNLQSPIVVNTDKEFAFYPGGKIEISAAAPGSFTISGWDKALVRVEMEKIFFYVAAGQAQELEKRYPARVTYTPTSAKVSTTGSAKPDGTLEVNVRIFVPRERTDLNIKMIKGDLSVSALSGWVEASLEEGNIETRDLAGYCSALTKLGDLKVELSGKRWTGYGFTGASRRGAIDLTLPIDYSAALQLETGDGTISVDFPEQIVQGESVPLQVVSSKKKRSVSAPIGSGGSPIRLGTSIGNISLKGIVQ